MAHKKAGTSPLDQLLFPIPDLHPEEVLGLAIQYLREQATQPLVPEERQRLDTLMSLMSEQIRRYDELLSVGRMVAYGFLQTEVLTSEADLLDVERHPEETADRATYQRRLEAQRLRARLLKTLEQALGKEWRLDLLVNLLQGHADLGNLPTPDVFDDLSEDDIPF